jgi:predicted RNA binding protein YcfA (HicA-like mRNA interferase family)
LSRLKLIDAKTMEKLLLRLGFEKVRQKGSHAFYRHADGRVTTIPQGKNARTAFNQRDSTRDRNYD